jgi:aldose 1-epimerase
VTTPVILLRHDGWTVRVLPHGGGLTKCVFRGQEILRSMSRSPSRKGAESSLCYYPLVPFFNRIKHGRFTFEGQAVQLEPNLVGHPHALHGHGWQAEWRVLQANATSCVLCFEHVPADGWLWRYRAVEKFSLAANVLRIELMLENLAAGPMPAGLGFHPFFPRVASARLRAAARRLSQGGAEQFPSASGEIPPALDFRHARPVLDARGLDHCYSGWDGSATVQWADAPWRVELTAEPLEHLHLYVAEDRNVFCVEPVSHSLDAFNFGETDAHAALALAAGAQRTALLALRCEASAARA